MRVLVAMNAFKGSLSAKEASLFVASGFKSGYPEAEVIQKPLADGGDGTVDVLVEALGGRVETVEVTGPYGEPVKAKIGLVDGGKTMVIESAACSGLALVPEEKRDVARATSRGVGELMLWAVERGARKIIVGIGGTAMNDGGIGAAQAAGGLVLDETGHQVEAGLPGLFRVSRAAYGSIPQRFRGVQVIGISDVANPLVGPEGATRVYGPQKGLKGEVLQKVERSMVHYGEVLARDLGRDPRAVPMAGAGGGLGAALWAFFGASLLDGARFILEQTGALALLDGVDLVITGEGRVDSQTEKGKVPFAVARAAQDCGIPVIVLGGGLTDDLLTGLPEEFAAVFSSTLRPMSLPEALERAKKALSFTAEQVACVGRVFAMSFPVRREISAGGVVVRRCASGTEILMIEDRFGRFALPKGHLDPGETPRRAALREVQEETGITALIKEGIEPLKVRYRFFDQEGKVAEKTVFYYCMEPVSYGDSAAPPKPAPGEVLGALWVKEEDLAEIKTYPGIRSLIKKILGNPQG